MIIYDGEADGQTKDDTYEGLTLRHPQAAHTHAVSLLPDYATSEAEHWKVVQPQQPKPRLLDSRILKGALYALVIYIFLSLVIVTPVVVIKSRKVDYEEDTWSVGPTSSLWSVENQVFPTPLQLSPAGIMSLDANKTCNVWSSTTAWNNTSILQFTLPPNGLVTIRSNVTSNFTTNQITGTLAVALNSDNTVKTIQFSAEVQFSSEYLRYNTHVCLAGQGSDRGLSIFVPKELGQEDNLNFRIEVLLPAGAAVDSFVTSLPMLTQNFDDFRPHFSANEFYIEGMGRPITCKFLQAPRILVKNVAGPIQGSFNVTDAIILDSVKGSIISNVTLTKPPSCTKPILLTMDTGDSAIQANIHLDSYGSLLSMPNSPSYIARVGNFNGPLDLNISYQNNAVGSPLHLQVENNLAKTTVAIDATYQGSFSAKAKLSQVTLTASGVLPEYAPSGKIASSRTNIVYDQNSGDIASGWIGRGPRPMSSSWKQSYVDIASALSPVALIFR
ncbi:hypothetical protein CPB84DRAFT_1823626 [Gymnopilus junonius]|uniref:Uncharacterized protein n=1 Tax=Gymnopilus junonius TaxID=109634 RepID=A0A9P5NS57_GYMJU|nr:hypothetical protein CPB84DRAFT_1823626 [Gymnopilus junonius]